MDPVIYAIDDDDRLVQVNEAWTAFAEENGGESVRATAILGRPLWNFVTGSTVRDIYRRLVRRARSGHRVQFTYRCDSPEKRRRFEMHLARRDTQLEFTSKLLSEEPRPRLSLFDSTIPHSGTIVRMCGWCHALAVRDGSWEPLESGVTRLGLLEDEQPPGISHGICEACAQEVLRTIPAARAP